MAKNPAAVSQQERETTMDKCITCGELAEPGTIEAHKDGCPEAFSHEVEGPEADAMSEDYPGQRIVSEAD
jgi:hypothetical protein